jgi:hypothetical protein
LELVEAKSGIKESFYVGAFLVIHKRPSNYFLSMLYSICLKEPGTETYSQIDDGRMSTVTLVTEAIVYRRMGFFFKNVM